MEPTFSERIGCGKCGSHTFKKKDAHDDPLYACAICDNLIGPKFSIEAALGGEPHTFVHAIIQVP
jgi:hypothetical protein